MRKTTATTRQIDFPYRLAVGFLAAGSMLALAAHAAQGQTADGASDQAMLEVATAQDHGEYITDAEGRAVYLFMADSKGNSTCYDACAEAWPPLVTSGEPSAGPQAQEDLLGTLQRKDGATQVTYNGWPLYYFVKDQGAGQTKGQDVEGFGAEWYLVSPQGEPVSHGGEHGGGQTDSGS